jgi:esterase/lipase superfamily enzyme
MRGSRTGSWHFGDETFARDFFTAQFGEATQQVALFAAQLGRHFNEHSRPQVATTA